MPVVYVAQVFLRKRRIVKEIGRRFKKDLRVARPAVALAGRAVGGDVERIGFRGPFGRFDKAVQKRIGAFEASGLLHVGVNGDSCDILRPQLYVRLHLGITEPEDRKGGFILVPSFAAGKVDLLQRRNLLFSDALNVFQRQISVLVQHFTEPPKHPLPRVSVYRERHIPRKVLPEIKEFFAVRRRGDNR